MTILYDLIKKMTDKNCYYNISFNEEKISRLFCYIHPYYIEDLLGSN